MGLFGPKFCDVCGEKIRFLGNRKLEDGNLCKDCADKLSPWFSERRQSTVAEIKEQLAYREANKQRVANFNVTKSVGNDSKIYLDEAKGELIATRSSNWVEDNPDVLDFSQVTGANVEIREEQTEIKRKNEDGMEESFDPPRYDTDYDFYFTIDVNSPWFDEMEFKLNDDAIQSRYSVEYSQMEKLADEMKAAIDGLHAAAAPADASAAAPGASANQ